MGVELDDLGYVKVSADQSTNMKGVFAAGDATTSSNRFRQIVTAASEGAIAANSILQYIQKGE
jgi:thioredoxin reductase (NADPH)